MKIDAINFGAFTGKVLPTPEVKAEETNSAGDDYDDTRVANAPKNMEQKVSNPIEKNGSIEDLMSMQASTEKMAHSYGYKDVEHATSATSASNSVQAVSNMNLNA